MKRPSSDARPKETRRSLTDNSGSRRRNSSVPYQSAKTDKHLLSIDSDTDFLCDRTVEFMDSGDVRNIVAVELAEQSMYFERLLRYHRGKGLIRLPEFLNSCFSAIIEFIRKNHTDISETNVYELFIASDYLLVAKLKDECSRFINLMANNASVAIPLWISCRHLYWPELGEMAYEKILEHFEKAWQTSEFLELDYGDVLNILSNDGLNCKSERNVFEAVLRWVRHNVTTRQAQLAELLFSIRINLLSERDVVAIRGCDLIKTGSDFAQLLESWPQIPPHLSTDEKINKLNPPRIPHEVVLVFGGWTDGEGPRAAAQVYDPRADSWTLWTEFSTDINLLGEIPRRVYAGCVLVEKRVYLIGGFDGTNALKSTLCYDFDIDSGWYEISCMYEKRYYVSVAYCNKFIYALGGHNGENQGRLDTAERFNLEENLWHPIAPMRRVRSDASAAELLSKIYICGGFEGRHYHDSTEYYDPDTNQWTLVNRMSSPRGGVSLVRHDNFLYAIGGNDGHSRLRSIERYDPIVGRWENVGNMNRRKSNLSSAVINDDIYIIGGWSDEPESGILDLVEKFNTNSRQSVIVHPLNFPASATCSCTLKDKNLVSKYIRRRNTSINNPLPPIQSSNQNFSSSFSQLTSHGEHLEVTSTTTTTITNAAAAAAAATTTNNVQNNAPSTGLNLNNTSSTTTSNFPLPEQMDAPENNNAQTGIARSTSTTSANRNSTSHVITRSRNRASHSGHQ